MLYSTDLASGWHNLTQTISLLLQNEGFVCLKENEYFSSPNQERFFILPLCQLEKLYQLRRDVDDYVSPAIFLVVDHREYPNLSGEDCSPYVNNDLIGNPKYGNICQAIFRAEVLSTKEDSKKSDVNSRKFNNIIAFTGNKAPVDSQNLTQKISQILAEIHELRKKWRLEDDDGVLGYLRKEYYTAMVGYYFPEKTNKSGQLDVRRPEQITCAELEQIDSESNILPTTTLKEVLEYIERFYCKLHDLKYGEVSHRTSHELFRAPVAFDFFELLEARSAILRLDDDSGLIKLLLIDNKTEEKFKGIEELLNKAGLTKKLRISLPGHDGKANGGDFRWQDFREGANENYRKNILQNIREAHFILLDFFLNSSNSYLAFDFIKDISASGRKKTFDASEAPTTWYFIASAIYDSVARYSESGLLAEYYESAVANSGDDPTNPKRQIIFLYKLLTFIHARIKSIEKYHNNILPYFFAEITVGCPNWHNGEKECQKEGKYHEQCFSDKQRTIKRFLAEDPNFALLLTPFYEEKKILFTLLDDTITKFQILPQADWQIIQHQIDYINVVLNGIIEKNNFSCGYITYKIKQWSEDY